MTVALAMSFKLISY